MEAIYLDCGARRSQLKRNPLGGRPDSGTALSETVSTRKGLAIIGVTLILIGLVAWGIEWPMRVIGWLGHLLDALVIAAGGIILWRRWRAKAADRLTQPPAA